MLPHDRVVPSGIRWVPHVGWVVSMLVILYHVLASLPTLSRTMIIHEVLVGKVRLDPDCRVEPLLKL